MSDLKTILGDSYNEGLTVSEIETLLADKNLVNTETLPKSVDKSVFDKTASELATIKKERDALKQSVMTDAEKAQQALLQAQESAKQYQTQLNKLTVEKLFATKGIKEEDYADMLDDIVSFDTDKAIALANKVVSLVSKQSVAVEQTVKQGLLNDTSRPPQGAVLSNGVVDYVKEIQLAQETGDLARAIALTRIQQTNQSTIPKI